MATEASESKKGGGDASRNEMESPVKIVFVWINHRTFLEYTQYSPKRRKKMKRKPGLLICIAILGISLLLVNSVAFGADKVIKLTFGSASSKGLPTYTALEKWAELVLAKNEGESRIRAGPGKKTGWRQGHD